MSLAGNSASTNPTQLLSFFRGTFIRDLIHEVQASPGRLESKYRYKGDRAPDTKMMTLSATNRSGKLLLLNSLGRRMPRSYQQTQSRVEQEQE